MLCLQVPFYRGIEFFSLMIIRKKLLQVVNVFFYCVLRARLLYLQLFCVSGVSDGVMAEMFKIFQDR